VDPVPADRSLPLRAAAPGTPHAGDRGIRQAMGVPGEDRESTVTLRGMVVGHTGDRKDRIRLLVAAEDRRMADVPWVGAADRPLITAEVRPVIPVGAATREADIPGEAVVRGRTREDTLLVRGEETEG
jgi:hypothetical protein